MAGVNIVNMREHRGGGSECPRERSEHGFSNVHRSDQPWRRAVHVVNVVNVKSDLHWMRSMVSLWPVLPRFPFLMAIPADRSRIGVIRMR